MWKKGYKIYIIHFPPLVPIFPPTKIGPSTNYIRHYFWSPLPKFHLLLSYPLSLHNPWLRFFHTQLTALFSFYHFIQSLLIIYFLCPHSAIFLFSSSSRLSPLPNIRETLFLPQPKQQVCYSFFWITSSNLEIAPESIDPLNLDPRVICNSFHQFWETIKIRF